MSQATRAAITESFQALMMSRRFSAFTVQDICKSAGISRSTFYTHFQDRQALLMHSVDPMIRDLAQGLLANGDPDRALQVVQHFWEQRRLSELWRDPVFRDRFEAALASHLPDLGKTGARFAAAGTQATLRAWVGGQFSSAPKVVFDDLQRMVQGLKPQPAAAGAALAQGAPPGREQ